MPQGATLVKFPILNLNQRLLKGKDTFSHHYNYISPLKLNAKVKQPTLPLGFGRNGQVHGGNARGLGVNICSSV